MQVQKGSAIICFLILLGNLTLSAQILDYSYIFQSTDTWTELTGDQVVFSGAFDDGFSAYIPTLSITMGIEPHTSQYTNTNGFMTLSTSAAVIHCDPIWQDIPAPVILKNTNNCI